MKDITSAKLKFKPDVDIWFDAIDMKFRLNHLQDEQHEHPTFCCENAVLQLWMDNERCKFFNDDKNTQHFWGYAYNLLFQAVDIDYDTDVWLLRLIGFVE